MNKREQALTHMRRAGYDGDRKAWLRLYCENRISRESAEYAYQRGERRKLDEKSKTDIR